MTATRAALVRGNVDFVLHYVVIQYV